MTLSLRLETRLERLAERHLEVGLLLGQPEVIGDNRQFRELSREYAELAPVAAGLSRYRGLRQQQAAARLLLEEPDFRSMAEEELAELEAGIEAAERALMLLLVPRDPRDAGNVFLEIRAGTGGDEAALFAGDLLRMYLRYAEHKRWRVEILSANEGEHGGYKEVVARIEGESVFSRLKFESGAHRVQRVPATESQGRIHTSACTVAILPELDEINEVEIDPSQLRIDTFRASGAGGQHVNKTDSAIRITHLPTGMVVECQDERSQHKNRARALALLKARLTDEERRRQTSEQSESRRLQVGSGDRSERIRTYNFPQGRLTDHRIGLTLYRLEDILGGDLEAVVEALQSEDQADLLKGLERLS